MKAWHVAAGVVGALGLAGAAWWWVERRGTIAAPVIDYTDENWLHGVTRYAPARVLVKLSAAQVAVGDTLTIDGEERSVTFVWADQQGGCALTLTGSTVLNPSVQGAPAVGRLRKAGAA